MTLIISPTLEWLLVINKFKYENQRKFPHLNLSKVHLRDSMVVVHCGQGSQKIKWLADVAIHRLDDDFGMETGLPKEIRFKSGVLPN